MKKITIDLPPLRSPAAEVSIAKNGDQLTISKPPEGFILEALAMTPPKYKEPDHYYYLLFKQEGEKERYRLFIGMEKNMHEAQQLKTVVNPLGGVKRYSRSMKGIRYSLFGNQGTLITVKSRSKSLLITESRTHPLYKGKLKAVDISKAKVETT